MPDVHYIRVTGEDGSTHVHSVDDWHFQEYCHTEIRGHRYLRSEFTVITEEEARAENPQLFGARDPELKMNAEELRELRSRLEFEHEMAEWAAKNGLA